LGAGPATAPVYEHREATSGGTGIIYMDREVAQFMSHLAADWLDRPTRELEEQPRKMISMMDLKPSDIVADIGAGTGYFSFRIAPKVPQGKVLAEDIQPEMLERVKKTAEEKKIANVEAVLGTETDPKLPEGSVDVALLVDAYHEFDHPREMMEGIIRGMKPGGRVVLVEYRGEDPNVPIKRLHKMTEAQAVKEMAAVGLDHVETKEDLPRQHVMIFRKPVKQE
jgi:ubiquinone/menaquinone biosynthesis C-methylase UbiE